MSEPAVKKGDVTITHGGARWTPVACGTHADHPCPKHETADPACPACSKLKAPGHDPSCDVCKQVAAETLAHIRMATA